MRHHFVALPGGADLLHLLQVTREALLASIDCKHRPRFLERFGSLHRPHDRVNILREIIVWIIRLTEQCDDPPLRGFAQSPGGDFGNVEDVERVNDIANRRRYDVGAQAVSVRFDDRDQLNTGTLGNSLSVPPDLTQVNLHRRMSTHHRHRPDIQSADEPSVQFSARPLISSYSCLSSILDSPNYFCDTPRPYIK